MTSNILTLSDLTLKHQDQFGREKELVSKLNLDIKKKEFVAIVVE